MQTSPTVSTLLTLIHAMSSTMFINLKSSRVWKNIPGIVTLFGHFASGSALCSRAVFLGHGIEDDDKRWRKCSSGIIQGQDVVARWLDLELWIVVQKCPWMLGKKRVNRS